LVDPYKELQFLDPGVRISRGFQEAWKDTADQVLEQVKKAREKYPDAAVIQTGHSLGAAIGLLGSLHLKHNLNIDIETILFGLPRTGNKEVRNPIRHHCTSLPIEFLSTVR
jgi:surfactin synthase thioesterase subunit